MRPAGEDKWSFGPRASVEMHGFYFDSTGCADKIERFLPYPLDDDIFGPRGIDREHGAIVLVRPDQYVSNVLPPDAYSGLAAFFAKLLIDRR